MKGFALGLLRVTKLIFDALKPIGLIISVMFILGASLFIYDSYQTIQDRRLGQQLIDNIKIEGPCQETISAGEKFNLKFDIVNNNDQSVAFEQLRIDKSLISIKDMSFLKPISTSPGFISKAADEGQYSDYFYDNLEIKSSGKKSLLLTFMASSRKEAQATAHSFGVYKGNLKFLFNHEMTIEVPCVVQVRYSN